MYAKEALLRCLAQGQAYVNRALEGLTQEDISWQPKPESNNIAFILWHMTRVEDYFINRVLRREEVIYETESWREKLGTSPKDTGYEYTAEQVRAWPIPKLETLKGYAKSVREKTVAYIDSLPPEKLSEVFRPEKSTQTIGAMLTVIVTEVTLHCGHIDYIRGMLRGLEHRQTPTY